MSTSDIMNEQTTETKIEVSYKILDFLLSFLYSAVYFTIPEVTDPLARLSITAIKLVRDPTKAIPAGPANAEITFAEINPAEIFTKALMPEKMVVLTSFMKWYFYRFLKVQIMFSKLFSDHSLEKDFCNNRDSFLPYLGKVLHHYIAKDGLGLPKSRLHFGI